MSEEIKPCPFCGSNEVEQFKKVNQIHGVKLFGYCCWNCGAESGISGIEEEAIQKWNQRPYDYDMPAIVKKVQQLEKLIGELQVEFEMIQEMAAEDIRLGWAMHTSLYQIETNSNAAIKKAAGVLCKQPE